MYKSCQHWRDPVKIGPYTVYASGSRHWGKVEQLDEEPIPEVGIYLCKSWMDDLTGFAACGMDSPVVWKWPFIIADWPDGGVMGTNDTAALLAATIKQVVAGKRVEVACMGGHGRTGTVLA